MSTLYKFQKYIISAYVGTRKLESFQVIMGVERNNEGGVLPLRFSVKRSYY